MQPFKSLKKDELLDLKQKLSKEYENYLKENLSLDMSRGKPSSSQLDLSEELLNLNISHFSKDKIDVRNYGVLDGLDECKALFADILGLKKENIIICGNSTLNTIYDCVVRFYIFGSFGHTPWGKYKKIKILCPTPGYDRHFDIFEKFGFEMIPIKMTENSIDMDKVEKLCKNDEGIKGIVCVPLHSNPTGTCYSNETIKRLAKLETKAKDFKIFWDNAYCLHHIFKEINILNILEECEKYNTQDRVLYFFSTSKVNFSGSGVAILGGSNLTIKEHKNHLLAQTIGYDKINQLRTVQFLKNKENVLEHMKKHGEILKPKFEIVLNTLKNNFLKNDILNFTEPLGGYFISVYSLLGCAKEIIELCKNAGVYLTPAGSTYPLKYDEKNSNIRLAPSFVSEKDLKKAVLVFTTCVKLASINKLIEN